MRKPSKLVAVIVPMSSRMELTDDEQISLRHLRHHLGHYDKYMVAPPGIDVPFSDFTVLRFDSKFFGSIRAHMDLLISLHFYNAFKQYKYILIHHLDAIVLSDRLEEWCARDFDYVAPPWIKYPGSPYNGITRIENQVGNGGFSLRKVQSFRRVLFTLWKPSFTRAYARRLLRRGKRIERRKWQEDVFWGIRAKEFVPDFNVADFHTALEFGFECNPRLCFEKNNNRLPFGVHDWPAYDRAFWEPHLLTTESS